MNDKTNSYLCDDSPHPGDLTRNQHLAPVSCDVVCPSIESRSTPNIKIHKLTII